MRAVPASLVGGCDAVEVRCALQAGHAGEHMSDPAPCRSLLGRRRWLVSRWWASAGC